LQITSLLFLLLPNHDAAIYTGTIPLRIAPQGCLCIAPQDGLETVPRSISGFTMAEPSPFLRPNEVEKISLLSAVTRWRHEKTGNFPRRIKITDRKIVYRKSEIDDWARDPEGWRERNGSRAEVA
jgi:predicted DNA-binding transcriptional regulator AlpA